MVDLSNLTTFEAFSIGAIIGGIGVIVASYGMIKFVRWVESRNES